VAIQGLITSRDVVRHGLIIVREFGLGAWLRCCSATIRGRHTTFLACVILR